MSGGEAVGTTEATENTYESSPIKNAVGSGSTEPSGGRAEYFAQQGLDLLCMVARLHGVAVDPASLSHQLALAQDSTVDFDLLRLAAQKLGLKARAETVTLNRLRYTPLPGLVQLHDGSWAMVAAANESQVLVQRALAQKFASSGAEELPSRMSMAEFAQAWLGDSLDAIVQAKGPMLMIASRASLVGDIARFDFSWFIPSLVRYRRLLGEVLGASIVLQLFALVTPLFFQVVMDKVLVHQGLSTLHVLVIGLLVISLFESALNFMRSYVFAHTTSRIDVELGSRLFRHLLRLPLTWFQARRVGDSVARVRELESIRSFLTGQALSLIHI